MSTRGLLTTAAAVVVLVLGALGLAGNRASAVRDGGTRVVRVVDGDTIVARLASGEERIRLIGIDTPESVDPRRPVECFGKEAARRLGDLLPAGTAIRLERDVEARDRFGRLLAYVHRRDDGLFVNLALAEDGYAQLLTIPPNLAYADRFAAAVASARAAGRGLWSAC